MANITGGISLGQGVPAFPEMETPEFATQALTDRWLALRNRQRKNFHDQQQLAREHNISLDVQQLILTYVQSAVQVLAGPEHSEEAQDKKLRIEESFEKQVAELLKVALANAVQLKLRAGTATPDMMAQLAQQAPGLVKRPGG